MIVQQTNTLLNQRIALSPPPTYEVGRGVTSGLSGGGVDSLPIALQLGPSLYLDFTVGATKPLGVYEDPSLILNFTQPAYQIEPAADPAYGYGLYLVQG
jgi:hypothetical protein